MKPVREEKAGRGRREWIRRKVGSRWHHGDVKARRVEGNGWVRFIRRTKRDTKIQSSSSPVQRNMSSSELYSSSASVAMRPEGVAPEPLDTGVSADATPPPGEAAGGDAAGAGESAEAGAGAVGGPFTSLRLRSFNRGQLAGTCHGYLAR